MEGGKRVLKNENVMHGTRDLIWLKGSPTQRNSLKVGKKSTTWSRRKEPLPKGEKSMLRRQGGGEPQKG